MAKENGLSKIKNFSYWLFDFWEAHALLTNLLISILPISLYCLGYLSNIRESTGSIISFASALITLNGVFLTLLVTLKGSPIFVRLKRLFPKLHDYMYTGLKKQVKSCIYLILINLTISLVGEVENIYIALIGIIIWSYYMVDVSLGSLYNLKVVTDLALNEVESEKSMT